MYDELVKRLREDAEDGYLIQTRIGDDIAEAAEAIDELQKLLDGVSADNDSLCERIDELSKALEAVQDAHNEGYDVGYWAGRRDYEPPKVET